MWILIILVILLLVLLGLIKYKKFGHRWFCGEAKKVEQPMVPATTKV
jgi:hypothetical protein